MAKRQPFVADASDKSKKAKKRLKKGKKALLLPSFILYAGYSTLGRCTLTLPVPELDNEQITHTRLSCLLEAHPA